MKKLLILLVALTACTNSNAVPMYRFEVTCQVAMTETRSDTLTANSYYYENGRLAFYERSFLPIRQFPANCFVKQLN